MPEYFLEVIKTLSWPIVALVIAFSLGKIFWVLARQTMSFKFGPTEIEFLRSDIADIRQTIVREERKKIADAIEAKRNNFLNVPNVSFHYVDKEQVTNFYNDYFREPTIESLVNEMATESSGDLKGKLPQLIEAKVGGKDISKWISTVKLPDTSLNGMFLRYQRETIKKGQVALGLEVVDVELTELSEFQKIVDDLRTRFELKIDQRLLVEREATIKEKAAETTLIKLEKATSYVLLEGQFEITDAGEDYYKCTYRHPVSDYILESRKIVTISFLLPKKAIESHVAGNYIQSVGQSIPLKVYGNVWQPVNREGNIWELTLTPLAVY
jgi:hypothetical protein